MNINEDDLFDMEQFDKMDQGGGSGCGLNLGTIIFIGLIILALICTK